MKAIHRFVFLALTGLSLMGNVSCESASMNTPADCYNELMWGRVAVDDKGEQAAKDYSDHTGVYAPSTKKN